MASLFPHKLSLFCLCTSPWVLMLGCVENISRDPELAPLIGQTVQLTEDYKICKRTHINISEKKHDFHLSFPLYSLNDPEDSSLCRTDRHLLIGKIYSGSEVKILSFKRRTGLSSDTLNVMVQVEFPEEESRTVEAEISMRYCVNCEFPWRAVN